MATTRQQAQEDIYEGVSQLVKEAARYSGTTRGRILVAAALAYRYVDGGAQPGAPAVSES